MEKVSVIIPMYNSEKTIEDTLNSIMNQNYENIEIIIIDDFSKDSSFKLCESKKRNDSRIVLIKNERNKGVSYCRNLGMKKATGDYVVFVDSDDKIRVDFIKKSLEYLHQYNADIVISGACKKNKKTEINLVIPENKIYSEDEIFLCKRLLLTEDKSIFDSTILGYVWGKLYKKEILENLFFVENICFREDMLFNYRAFSNAKKIYIYNDIGYDYILQNSTTSLKVFPEYEKEIINFFEYFREDDFKILENEILICGLHMYMNYLKHFVMHKDKKSVTEKSNYKLIKETFKSNFWNKMFFKVDSRTLTTPYKLLQICFKMKFAYGIIILYKINSLRKKIK